MLKEDFRPPLRISNAGIEYVEKDFSVKSNIANIEIVDMMLLRGADKCLVFMIRHL